MPSFPFALGKKAIARLNPKTLAILRRRFKAKR
ncbi:hypothetical protein SPLA10_PHROGS00189 [Salmonella phage SPLA10]|nr:hypothetical protein SPLA10_PHROGS00189 [Salmonella phage SPLA10]